MSDIFSAKLKELNQTFETDSPELELTVRDHQLGLEGYVVVWNSAPGKKSNLGPFGKGGTRITPNLSLDEIKMLAKRMALKNAAAGLYMGGAKSGIKADPDEKNFEVKYRRFVQLIKPILRENGGIFGGLGFDIGARPVHPKWACDELKSFKSFTGKPLEMGGTDYDKEGIAGLGVATAAKVLLEYEHIDLSKATVAIQGLEAMGAAVLRDISHYGMKVKYIADPRIGGCYLIADANVAEITNLLLQGKYTETQALLEKNKAVKSELDSVLFQDVDLIVPSAVQDVITKDNAVKVKAKYLVEGANGPTTKEAYEILQSNKVKIIPDFIANPGGVIAAYIELVSDVTVEENIRTRKKVEDAKKYTIEKITENVHNLLSTVQEYKVDNVTAAKYLALSNLYHA